MLRQLFVRRPAVVAEYCATIVVMSAVTKLDALAIVALAVDSPVENQRTMRPYVPLAGVGAGVDASAGDRIGAGVEAGVGAGARTRARGGVRAGAWVEIEIPKFGEPPPLAIDVYSTLSDDHARLQALTLLATLEQYTGWNIRPDFTV